MKREALYWHNALNGIRCDLCPNNCLLKEGDLSPCRTRIVVNGKLYTPAWGNLVASNIDPIEKKPLYHFNPGHRTFSIATAGCNLHCKNCQNASISQISPTSTNQIVLPKEIVRKAIRSGCESISLTYTDPVAYFEYALDIAMEAKKNSIPIILVSAGYINPAPLQELLPYISSANIDLKAMTEEFYRTNCKAKLAPVLDTIKTIHHSDIWLEITNLIIPDLNDTEQNIQQLSLWMTENKMHDVPIHFSRFFPCHQLKGTQPTSAEIMFIAKSIAEEKGLKYVYLGNMHSEKGSDTICPACGKTLIRRNEYHTQIEDGFTGNCPACNTTIPGNFQGLT